MSKVITAMDMAKKEGSGSVIERIGKFAQLFGNKFVTDRTAGNPVFARIDYGRWLADCECGGAEYVDPETPVFFCQACGNRSTSGRARPVIFPENREQIEAETMEKPAGGHQCWTRGEA